MNRWIYNFRSELPSKTNKSPELMPPAIAIKQIDFKNGMSITLNSNSIVVFVGPNNSAKSRVLKEIASPPSFHNEGYLIVKNVEFSTQQGKTEILARIEERLYGSTYFYPGQKDVGMDRNALFSNIDSALQGHQVAFPVIAKFFTRFLDTADRLQLVNPAQNIDPTSTTRTHPIHYIKDDREKELQFSYYFNLAFGQEIVVNHGAGHLIPLHVGKRPSVTQDMDRVSRDYLNELRKLPQLHEQGDGMKSFAGVFLTLLTGNADIDIADEPEAFLHPPQATLLGQMISQNVSQDKQVFISTHSEHFLKGLIDGGSDRLIVIRMQRDQSVDTMNVLDNNLLKQIWADPILRHTNVLDGLFHKRVILTESDSDCQFYNALTIGIVESRHLPSQDILFIQSGGKSRFPVVIQALKSLSVPLWVIGDFDFYHDEHPTKNVFTTLGGDWSVVKDDFTKVKKAIDEKYPELLKNDLKKEIDNLFVGMSGSIVPDHAIKGIKKLLKKSSPWSQAKASGKAYLPAGEPTRAFMRCQQAFKDKHLLILELGEIEAFDKAVGGHGPNWVNRVLEKDYLHTEDLAAARTFIIENILEI